jgi:hypothetical protein
MHLTLQFFGLWALAFVTLCAALVLLNIFDSIIGNDLTLLSLGKEVAIATVASLIEGASVWAVVAFLPGAIRGLFIPAAIVALLYKISHLEDWSRYDILMLVVFQTIVALVAALLLTGNFPAALLTIVVFGGILALVAGFMRGL